MVIPHFFISHSQVKSDMRLFLDVLSAHSSFRSHEQFCKRSFFARKNWDWWSISRSRWNCRGDWTVRSFWRFNSDLFFVETLRTPVDLGLLEWVNSLIKVLADFMLLERLLLLFNWGSSGSFLELQQSFIIFADLLCHNYLLTFCLFLNLREDLLTRI